MAWICYHTLDDPSLAYSLNNVKNDESNSFSALNSPHIQNIYKKSGNTRYNSLTPILIFQFIKNHRSATFQKQSITMLYYKTQYDGQSNRKHSIDLTLHRKCTETRKIHTLSKCNIARKIIETNLQNGTHSSAGHRSNYRFVDQMCSWKDLVFPLEKPPYCQSLCLKARDIQI